MASKKTPSWASAALLEEYDGLAVDLTYEEAAGALRSKYEFLRGKGLEAIMRGMRSMRREAPVGPRGAVEAPLMDEAEEAAAPDGDLLEDELAGKLFQGSVPPPLASTAFKPLVLPYQDSLVWCDTHVPFHMNDCMEESLNSALSNGVRQIILAGDFMDIHWGSRFIAWKTEGAHVENVRQEFAISQAVFKILLNEFDSVVVIPGNHDGGRFQHMSGGAFDFRLLCSLMGGFPLDKEPENLTIGMNRWMVLEGSPWGDWRITHPQKARAVPLALAEVLAWKYSMNILTAHQHYLGARMDRYGKHIVCDGGHMQNEGITDYKVEVDNSHSNWTPGWVELLDGWPVTRAYRPKHLR